MGLSLVKKFNTSKGFCKVEVGQFNGKFNSNLFSLLDYLSMAISSKVMVYFVLELALAEVWVGQYLSKRD